MRPQVGFLIPQVHTHPVGVLSHKARGEEKLCGAVSPDAATLPSAGPDADGAQRLLLGPCGPQSTCVCWVDWLVPVTSWEPLV